MERRTKEILSLHLDLSQEEESRLQKYLILLSASCLCCVKSTITTRPPTQVVNSDNSLMLAFHNTATKMTGDNSTPLDRIISTTCSRNYNSAYSAVLEASFFLIFSLFFPWKSKFWTCKQKIIQLKILESEIMKSDLQVTNHHVFWHTSSIHKVSPNDI